MIRDSKHESTENDAAEKLRVGLSSSFTWNKWDWWVLCAIAAFAVGTVYLHQRTPDFMGEDVFFGDAARSLLSQGFYGVNGVAETSQPPGLAAILSAVFLVFGYSYAAAVGTMAVFEAIGVVAFYCLIRGRIPQRVAVVICIVLLSSPLCFAWATRPVFPCLPYFCTTMIALVAAERYDSAAKLKWSSAWGVILAISVGASILIATGTMVIAICDPHARCRIVLARPPHRGEAATEVFADSDCWRGCPGLVDAP